MPSTYDDSLPTSKDHVRFLIGDVTSPFEMSDEGIATILADTGITGNDQAMRHIAAADCLGALRAKWLGSGRGVIERQIGRLRIDRGETLTSTRALDTRIQWLRERGAWFLNKSVVESVGIDVTLTATG